MGNVAGSAVRSARILRRLAPALIALLPCIAAAQPAPDSSRVSAPRSNPAVHDTFSTAPSSEADAGAPLVLEGDTIVTFRATVAGVTPARRAEVARGRLEALPLARLNQPVHVEPFADGRMVLVGDLYAFLFMDQDAASGADPDRAAELVGQRLGNALSARARQRTPGERLRGTLLALAGTLVLVVLLRLLSWLKRRALEWISSKSQANRGRLTLGNVDYLAQASAAVTWLARVGSQVAGLALVFVWLVFVLNRFPETQRWGAAARGSVVGVLLRLEEGAVRAVPGVIAVTVIILLARLANRLATDIFHSIEHGTLRLRGVHPETAGATRRLVTVLIWLLAIVVAYPMLPGSDSDAFKGLSVFIGLIVTLGSSGVVGHMMSGLVVVYSRSLRAGDVIRVNDIEGSVTEVGALSVKIANARLEEFTIPNQVIVGTTVKNYSRLSRDAGPVLTTSVTIGYDAPWRVVYEMLLAAAERTPGIRRQPAPVVFQPNLSDFYVEYQLVVRLERAEDRFLTLTLLHQNIQDAFNERGVQIMSPHFEGQPGQAVVVPKSNWSRAPGDPPGSGTS